jgi:hypothetical protein
MPRRFLLAVAVALSLALPAAAGPRADDKDEGPALKPGAYPTLHRSTESEVGRPAWPVDIRLSGAHVSTVDLSRAFPAWVDVDGPGSRIVEGVVTASDEEEYPGPHVSREEFPLTHYTHDLTFHVRPDPAYIGMLGVQRHIDGHETLQDALEVEWESGLGADNPGNPMSEPNRRGESAGFFSAGHRRGDSLWNWPTKGDRVHLEGRWIWDRGHPPADTEIHPLRLVSTTRHLPAVLRVLRDRLGNLPLQPLLATRVDIFASGDGGALANNRTDVPAFVARVPMSDRDYQWDVAPIMPAPATGVRLRAAWATQPGDSRQLVPQLTPRPDGLPGFRVTLPWKSGKVPDTAIFAQTLYLYWEGGDGARADYKPSAFRIILDHLDILKSQDVGPGQFRIFMEAGGNWLSANELVLVPDILRDGLGRAEAGDHFGLNRSVVVVVPAHDTFRLHADGWEADGVNSVFGHLLDPLSPHDETTTTWLMNNLFSWNVFLKGGRDDPAGEINVRYGPENHYGVGAHADTSQGLVQHDAIFSQDTDPSGTYRLHYHIEPCDWRTALAPCGWVDCH